MIYQRIIFKCDKCSAELDIKLPVYVESVLVLNELPPGWNRVNNKVYCNKHSIDINDINQ